MQRIAGLSVAPGFSVLAASCGGPPKPPERGVIDADLGESAFRRRRSVVDAAVAHTASVARCAAERTGRLGEADVVNASLARDAREEGILRAVVVFARRLARDDGGRASVPGELVEADAERCPSRLAAGILDGPPPGGPAEKRPETEPFDPDDPRPEWQT